MNHGLMMKRMRAIEARLSDGTQVPVNLVRMQDGTIRELYGMNAVPALLAGGVEAITCFDADIAALLRALDSENQVKIEVVWMNGDSVVRRVSI